MRLTWRTRRWKPVAAVVGVVLALGSLVVLAGRLRSDETPWRSATTTLGLAGPDEIVAGEPWEFRVDAGFVDSAFVTVTGPWGSESFTIDGRTSTFSVPAALTTHSGRLLAVVRAGDALGTVSTQVRPRRAIDGTTPLAGPRSMIADRAHWTMVTMLPRDRYGNVVVDSTAVQLRVRRPDGSVETYDTTVADLYAAVRVFSETLAGRTAVRIDVDGATGEEIEVLEVPGPPAEVAILEPSRPLRADGRDLVELRTATLVDRFGNELLDGTAAVAQIDGPSGRSTLRTVTIDGRAELVVEAPEEPGRVTVELVVDGVRSAPLELEFAPDVNELPLDATRENGRVRVDIGPVLSELGGFVPDGTVVLVDVAGRRSQTAIEDGVAAVVLDAEPGTVVAVEVLGTRSEVEVP